MHADAVFRYGHLTVLGAIDGFLSAHEEARGARWYGALYEREDLRTDIPCGRKRQHRAEIKECRHRLEVTEAT